MTQANWTPTSLEREGDLGLRCLPFKLLFLISDVEKLSLWLETFIVEFRMTHHDYSLFWAVLATICH